MVPVLVLVLVLVVLTSTRPQASKKYADKIKYLVKEQKNLTSPLAPPHDWSSFFDIFLLALAS